MHCQRDLVIFVILMDYFVNRYREFVNISVKLPLYDSFTAYAFI